MALFNIRFITDSEMRKMQKSFLHDGGQTGKSELATQNALRKDPECTSGAWVDGKCSL